MAHTRDIAAALVALRDSLAAEGIPFAVIGALAMRQHGYVRHTEDIDIVTTAEGLARIHERLVGRGIVARGPGLRKKLRDAARKVDIDVLVEGEHAGAPGSPVVYPAPGNPAFAAVADGIRYASLRDLIAFKLASGIWGKRPQDFGDVHALIKVNRLDESYAATLPEAVRERFAELARGVREERDIE